MSTTTTPTTAERIAEQWYGADHPRRITDRRLKHKLVLLINTELERERQQVERDHELLRKILEGVQAWMERHEPELAKRDELDIRSALAMLEPSREGVRR